jgi:hypothetical protein
MPEERVSLSDISIQMKYGFRKIKRKTDVLNIPDQTGGVNHETEGLVLSN